ncbi:hypothetical protein HYZ41_02070 [archaeon]|nr:hypothetical protein [archaeon]
MKTYKLKNIVKGLGIAYIVFGSLSMLGEDVTGHRSSDLYLGKRPLTGFEKAIYKPFFETSDKNAKDYLK